MTAVPSTAGSAILQPYDLAAFRRRIMLLSVLRSATIGASIGVALGIIAELLDLVNVIDVHLWELVAFLCIGASAGAIVAIAKRSTENDVARSVDLRAGLDDRLTTVAERAGGSYQDLLLADTSAHLVGITPAQLYPLRAYRAVYILAILLLTCVLLYLAADTTLLMTPSRRADVQQMAAMGAQVRLISRPEIVQASQQGATRPEKELARDLQTFSHDLVKGRLGKQEALIKANELAEKAQALEAQRAQELGNAALAAQTAGEKLQEMADPSLQQNPDNAAEKLSSLESALEKQVSDLEKQLSAGAGSQGKMGAGQREALQSKIKALQRQIQQIRISQQALATLSKLMAMPQYQEAMKLLQQLQNQAGASSSGQQPPMSPDELKAAAEKLEALANKLSSNAAMKAYADALLAAAKAAKAGGGQCSGNLLSVFGLNAPFGQNCQSDSSQGSGADQNGRGGTGQGVYLGLHTDLHHFDKSSLLNIKFDNRVITSQQGNTGPVSYTDVTGPAKMTGKSQIPYEDVLPKYENSAESALSKGNVPPEMRSRVRDYFNSLHQ